jgi:hypothetical protein
MMKPREPASGRGLNAAIVVRIAQALNESTSHFPRVKCGPLCPFALARLTHKVETAIGCPQGGFSLRTSWGSA